MSDQTELQAIKKKDFCLRRGMISNFIISLFCSPPQRGHLLKEIKKNPVAADLR